MTLGHHIWIPLLGQTWIDDKKFGHPKEEWNQVFISKEKCSIFDLKFWFAAYFFTQFSNEKKFYSFSSSAEINKLFIVLYYTSGKMGATNIFTSLFFPIISKCFVPYPSSAPVLFVANKHVVNFCPRAQRGEAAPIHTYSILPMNNMSAHPAVV